MWWGGAAGSPSRVRDRPPAGRAAAAARGCGGGGGEGGVAGWLGGGWSCEEGRVTPCLVMFGLDMLGCAYGGWVARHRGPGGLAASCEELLVTLCLVMCGLDMLGCDICLVVFGQGRRPSVAWPPPVLIICWRRRRRRRRRRQEWGSNYFKGYVDDLRIYGAPLDQPSIAAAMSGM